MEDADDSELFSSNLSFYTKTPSPHTVEIMKFVEMAEERLKLYAFLEKHPKCKVAEVKNNLESPLTKLLDPPENHSFEEIERIRAMDYGTHWLLRIGYCVISHSYFVKNELLWFKLRYEAMSEVQRDEFLKQNNLSLTEASDEEKLNFDLVQETHYKIPWEQALHLVKTRQCFLDRGFLYVSKNKVHHFLLQKFEKQLYNLMQHSEKMYPNCPEQLTYILSLLDLPKEKRHLKKALKLSELSEVLEHFPLCMKLQYEKLMKDHHLKHYSRLQLGLFLKGIGLSLEDTLEFFKTEFNKDINKSKARFEKDYAYYFKHMYGVVGSKTDYDPLECKKIIEWESDGGVHGCAYKQLNSGNLRLKLQEFLNADVNRIVDLAKKGKYCEACTLCYNSRIDCNDWEQIITHPNDYYEKSLKTELKTDIGDIEDIFQDFE